MAQVVDVTPIVKRAFYASTLHHARHQHDEAGAVLMGYMADMAKVGIDGASAAGLMMRFSQNAVIDILGDSAEEDLANALYELEMDGA